jgi:hypothetical protein
MGLPQRFHLGTCGLAFAPLVQQLDFEQGRSEIAAEQALRLPRLGQSLLQPSGSPRDTSQAEVHLSRKASVVGGSGTERGFGVRVASRVPGPSRVLQLSI